MDQILEFAGNHWVLVLLLVGVLIAIAANELRLFLQGAKALEPGTATQLYNQQGAQFIDIRAESEFHKGHLPDAIHLPQSNLSSAADGKLGKKKERPLVVYCNTGNQSAKAAASLQKQGFGNVYELKGGYSAWQSAGYPVQRKR